MNNADMKIEFFGETNQGMVRQNNEDCFIAQYIWDEKFLLCAVIDGMGGYEGGEVASDLARTTLLKSLEAYPSGDIFGALKQAFIDANNEIVRYRQASPMYSSMGCVATVGLFDLTDPKLFLVHVGDSRLYRFQGGNLEKLSHDHSLVGYREEIGDLTEEEAMKHPNRSVISRSVGDSFHFVEDDDFLETSIFPIYADSDFLFCSDGLSDMLRSQQIASVLATDKPVKEKVEELIKDTNEAGGKDNVTVVIAQFRRIETSQNDQEETETFTNQESLTPSTSDKDKSKRKKIWIGILSCLLLASIGLCVWFYFRPVKKSSNPNELQTPKVEAEVKPIEKAVKDDSGRVAAPTEETLNLSAPNDSITTEP